jgi:hypothetical protein
MHMRALIPTKFWCESCLAYLCSVLVMHASAPKAQLAANRRRTTSIGTNVTSQTRILKKQSPSKCWEIAEMQASWKSPPHVLYQTRGHAHNVCDLSGGGALPMMSFSGPFTCGWGIPHHDVARAQGATHIDRPIVRVFGVTPQTKTKKENLGTICLCRIQTFCLLCFYASWREMLFRENQTKLLLKLVRIRTTFFTYMFVYVT